MRSIVRAGNPEYKTIHFSWYLTNWCNFSCNYCASAGKMTEKWQHEDSMSQYKFTLARLKKLDTDFELDMVGGEPTLHPKMADILLEVKSIPHCKAVLVATNLSRSLNYYKKLDRPELAGVEIAASLHPDFVDDKFMDKALVLKDSQHIKFSVTLIMSDESKHWPVTLERIKMLKENGVNYSLQILSDTSHWTSAYPKEFYELFQSELDWSFADISQRASHINLTHKYEFNDGTVEYLNDFQIYEKRFDRFKGFTCTPLFYEISVNGEIENICTGRKVGKLMPKAADFIQQEVCPLDCCKCENMFNFPKENLK